MQKVRVPKFRPRGSLRPHCGSLRICVNGCPRSFRAHLKIITSSSREGGADHPLNVAAVCPNCHQRVTHGRDAKEHNAVIEQNVKATEAKLETTL
ncbi:HNH endonuclease [Bradyrhizobium sp. AZCC 1578]|uniref:HNH endonuclease n=1 Tax=Bradyrhizobium sp. AZCC 1578 TaxID=3117027 RepID=UPI003FA5F1A3